MPSKIVRSLIAASALVATATMAEQRACLTFEQALQLSVKIDPAVAVARAREAEAASELKEARSLYKPQVSAFARTGTGSTDVVDSVIQNQVGLRISQRLIDFGDAKYARRAASGNLKSSMENVHQARILAAQESALAYLAILDTLERLEATKQRKGYFQRQLDSVNSLLEQGGATLSEQADVAAQLADTEAFYLELQFQLEQARTQLAINTGEEQDICHSDNVGDYLRQWLAPLPNSEQAVAVALAQSPVVNALQQRTNSLQAQREREKRNNLPVVNVVGIASYSSTGNSVDGNGNDFELQDRIGIDVSVPLYSGSALSARKQRSASREEAARSQVREAKRQLREQVSILWRRIDSLSQQLQSRRVVERQYLKQLDAADIEHQANTRTLPELIEVRLEYEQSRLLRIQTKFDLLRQQLQLLALTAKLPLSEIPDNVL